MYKAYITKIKNIKPAENADRLEVGECFGNFVVFSKDSYNEHDLYIYFPVGGQLSVDYCEHNNLVRKKDEAGNNVGGYLDPDKRNITAIRLRGNKSDGLVMPLNSVEYTGIDLSSFKEGDIIADIINGCEICTKYIPRTNRHAAAGHTGTNRVRKKRVPIAPLFLEHADTEQLAYNLSAFKPGDLIEITLKMHGTSQRTGYVPVFQGYKRTFFDKLFKKEGTPIYNWGYVSGTRRTVLENFEGGYYGSNEFREPHSKHFEGKLLKGETVYYEVVGFTTSGTPIMGTGKNDKLGKDFVKQYGKTTVFSYGCSPDGELIHYRDEFGTFSIPKPQSDIYVYRMTMTNEDGDVVEYTPDFMRYRCEQMGVKTVPVFWKGYLPEVENLEEWIRTTAEDFYEGLDPVGKTHIREGVVVRIINRPKFTAFKHKSFEFRVLEGIISADNIPQSEDITSEM